MNVIKVSIKTNTHKNWIGYFDGMPTLKKLKEIVGISRRHSGGDILTVLRMAKIGDYSSSSQNFTRWVTLVRIASTQIGTIEYEKVAFFPLSKRCKSWIEDDGEQVVNFPVMNS